MMASGYAHQAVSQGPSHADLIQRGQALYLTGRLASGDLIKAKRLDLGEIKSGSDMACVKCHRPSGMGSLEGDLTIPPITGRFLFQKEEGQPVAVLDPRTARKITQPHPAYSLRSLSKVLREGVDIRGKKMSPLMPHYTLADDDVRAIMAYLDSLSATVSPGVSPTQIRFATIITPDTPPHRKDLLIKMLSSAFHQRNVSQRLHSGSMGMPMEHLPHVHREWDLAVWEVTGDPSTWQQQLIQYNQDHPAFAIFSGTSEGTWEPIQDFCERGRIPCLFPSLIAPPQQTGSHSFNFSKGLALEAAVLSKFAAMRDREGPTHWIQVHKTDVPGQLASKTFIKSSEGQPRTITDIEWDGSLKNLQDQLQTNAMNMADSSLILWLSSEELEALHLDQWQTLPKGIYLSGHLTHGHPPQLPETMAASVHVISPYEVGLKRSKQTDTLRSWLKTWDLPLSDEAFQSEVFFDLLMLTDLSSQMLDNLYRDYLIERTEDMLSWGTNVSVYPRLSLSREQHYASQGAYVTKLDSKGQLVPESDWMVP